MWERTLSAALLSLVTIVTGGILASSHVSAEDNTSIVDEIGIEIPVSCTMSGTDVGSSATGSSLTTTYQGYISYRNRAVQPTT